MNKTQLAEIVAAKANLKKKDADAIVSAIFDSISDALAAGEKVQLFGFGGFEVKERAARIGRNPRTKEEMTIPAFKCACFTPSKALKESVNE
ncbi:MAG: HU family DNA-binding protein [Ruminococcaceae bacterium]|nr:HU family DNA-binding protein [Oscillospiraceae bacterium]